MGTTSSQQLPDDIKNAIHNDNNKTHDIRLSGNKILCDKSLSSSLDEKQLYLVKRSNNTGDNNNNNESNDDIDDWCVVSCSSTDDIEDDKNIEIIDSSWWNTLNPFSSSKIINNNNEEEEKKKEDKTNEDLLKIIQDLQVQVRVLDLKLDYANTKRGNNTNIQNIVLSTSPTNVSGFPAQFQHNYPSNNLPINHNNLLNTNFSPNPVIQQPIYTNNPNQNNISSTTQINPPSIQQTNVPQSTPTYVENIPSPVEYSPIPQNIPNSSNPINIPNSNITSSVQVTEIENNPISTPSNISTIPDQSNPSTNIQNDKTMQNQSNPSTNTSSPPKLNTPPPPPPSNAPPPPPLIFGANNKLVMKKKTGMHIFSNEEIKKQILKLLQATDIAVTNHDKVANNFTKSFDSEKARVFASKLIHEYPGIIKKHPLNPPLCIKLMRVWEKYLFIGLNKKSKKLAEETRKKYSYKISNMGDEASIRDQIKLILDMIRKKEIEEDRLRKLALEGKLVSRKSVIEELQSKQKASNMENQAEIAEKQLESLVISSVFEEEEDEEDDELFKSFCE